MIKKISFIIIITCLILSCGKKGDPEFKTFKKDTRNQNLLSNNS